MTNILKISNCSLFFVAYDGRSLVHRYYTKDTGKTTYCYIFAIRKGDDERLVFGRTAFEGINLIFNRSGKVLTFSENSCCGPEVRLRSIQGIKERMSLCLPRSEF